LFRSTFIFAVALLLLACNNIEPLEADLVIENVRIISLDDGTVTTAEQVAIRDGIITHVGDTEPLKGEPDIVDAEGAYVIPGLWDAHIHSISAADWHFPLMVRHGVTSVRNMHTSEEEPFEKINSIRARIASGELTGPMMIANGPIVDGPRPAWDGVISINSAEEAGEVVETLASSGADFIKVYDGLAPEVYEAVMKEANARSLPVDGHLPNRVDPKDAARLGHRSDEHTSGILQGCSSKQQEIRDQFTALAEAEPLPFPQNMIAQFANIQLLAESWDVEECRKTAEVYAAHDTVVTPTLVNLRSMTNPQSLMDDEEAVSLVPEEMAEWWREELSSEQTGAMSMFMSPVEAVTPDTLNVLVEAGVPVLAGTDVGNPFLVPGYHLHTELELMVDAGMSPLAALRSATIVPAEILVPDMKMGRIETGYRADIVLLSANPLEDISNTREISAVILNGRSVPLE
jgi:hypothetical protein